ncbi:type III-B CRISPR module-associated protein Cmr5 [Candidatus Parabeggiatoa sp. HSG14]|uniref:type III-B CRISPR module-associated protein Cmr5 n=1 Tax=Candidatus Parabeggiatoa sp. HSG14 TaxID=3055593 RepID=UPI0025A8855B|nr:type III-B CRISPR module-associated protein Cmr5 [Thiotrichales bacterium HSG14]
MQTMQQQRAAFALEGVEKAREELDEKQRKEYKSHVSALPFMIHANGLGQAAAFYKSKCADSKGKKKLDYLLLYQLLSDWLSQDDQPFAGMDLLEGITKEDMHAYITAQAEAMVFMSWVKKFATAFMQDEITKEENK